MKGLDAARHAISPAFIGSEDVVLMLLAGQLMLGCMCAQTD